MSWTITARENRLEHERIDLGKPGSLPWASIDIDQHVMAVIVFGDTQRDADARAQLILQGIAALADPRMHLPTLRRDP